MQFSWSICARWCMAFIMETIAENIKRVRDAISDIALKSGRDPGGIALVAAAKTKPAALVRQAIAAGVDAIGENRVQEMLEKNAQDAYSGAPLHFIGQLQSNKINKIVGVCDLIESVGSQPLISAIGKRAASLGIVQDILVEVNIGKEPQKSGILPEEAEDALALASLTEGVRVLGFMAIPPIQDKIERNCNLFDLMCNLFIDMSEKKYDNVVMQFLSMGMSDSYVEAIRHGANMVRIGSAIFGGR